MSDPIFLYDEYYGGNTTGKPSILNRRQQIILKNPSKTAMLVTDIRFMIITNDDNDPSFGQDGFRVRIRVGNYDVTDGDVPIVLLCPRTSPAYVFRRGQGLFSISLGWKLPKPLYVPRNGQVTFDFTYANDATVPAASLPSKYYDAMQIGVGLAGTALDSDAVVPHTVQVPYAKAWLTPPGAGASIGRTGAGCDYGKIDAKSGVSDLVNTRKWPLHLNHMMICSTVFNTSFSIDCPDDAFAGYEDSPQLAPSALGVPLSPLPASGIRMQARDTRGGFIVRDTTPIAMVFNIPERSWKMNTILAPNNYILLTLTGAWEATYTGGTRQGLGIRLGFALLGYHDVPIADLGVSL